MWIFFLCLQIIKTEDKFKMSKERVYGLSAIISGLILFLPMFFAAYAIEGGGSESFFIIISNFTRTGTPAFYIVSALFTIFTIIAAVSLIVIGFLKLVGIKNKILFKVFKWTIYVTGALAVAAGVSAILLAVTYSEVDVYPFNIGVGAVLLTIVGIAILFQQLIIRKILRNRKEKSA